MSKLLKDLKKIEKTERSKISTSSATSTAKRSSGESVGKRMLTIALRLVIAAIAISAVVYAGVKAKDYWVLANQTKVAKPAISVSPMDIQKKQNSKALSLSKSGKHEQAAKILSEIVAEFPKQIDAYINLAMVYKRMGELKKAKKILKKVVKVDKQNVVALNNLGMVALASGDIKLALKSFESATKHQDNLPEPIFNLASTYEKTQKFSLAIEYYKKFMTHPRANSSLARKVKLRMPRLHSLSAQQERERGQI